MAGFDRDTNIESIKQAVIEMRFKIDELTNAVYRIMEKMDNIIELLKANRDK